MEINSTSTGASTYAMKKAMDMPNQLLSLVQQAGGSGQQQTLAADSLAESQRAVSTTGKGQIIDIVA